MSKKLGICIAGCGWMGRVHAEGLQSLADRVDVYYLSRTEEKAKEYIEKHGGAGFFTRLEDVLSSPAIDALDVCLPHDMHLEHVVKAFQAGKHVATEKPMSMNVAEADQMLAAAAKAGKKFAVVENFRYYPHLVKGAAMAEEGAVGEVFFIQVNFMAYYVVSGWRRPMSSAGGGVLIDVGHHFIDLAVMLGGEVASVFAQTSRKTVAVIDAEDTAILNLKYRNGAIGGLNLSFGAPKAPAYPMFVVYGNKGTIYYNDKGLFVHTGSEPQLAMERNEAAFKEGLWSEAIRNGARDFALAILEDREPVMTGQKGRHDMAIISAGINSAKIGEMVNVP